MSRNRLPSIPFRERQCRCAQCFLLTRKRDAILTVPGAYDDTRRIRCDWGGQVLNGFGEGEPGIRRNPGTDMNFRRSLPEIRCLSSVCPAGYAPRSSCPPKRLSTPSASWHRNPSRDDTVSAERI